MSLALPHPRVAGRISSFADVEALARALQQNLEHLSKQPRIIRGEVAANGSDARGAGFSVAKTGTGLYTVTFDIPFRVAPVVVVGPGPTSGANGAKLTTLPAPSTSGFGVTTFTTNTATPTDLSFAFVAVET